MTDLYFDVLLETIIIIEPKYLNNNLHKHIKDTVINKHENKCFKDYGLITKIHDVLYDNMEGSRILPSSQVVFSIKFSCIICNPIINEYIEASIENCHKVFIRATCGPIKIIITENSINFDKFVYANDKNTYCAKINGKLVQLKINDKIRVKILSKKIINNEDSIMTMGYLEDFIA